MMMGTTVRKTARNRSSDGFTLVELLVVVAIIALIATIAVALLHAQVDKAKLAAVAADLRAFEFGFLSYASDNGTLPPDSHLDPPYHLPKDLGVEDYVNVKQSMTDAGLEPEDSELTMRASANAEIDLDDARKVLRLVDLLENSDDVQDVYYNVEIPEEAYEAEG